MPPSQLRSVYGHTPRWGQTTALNLYGLSVRRREAAWGRILADLESTERLPRAELLQLTQESLCRVLGHAMEHVPRYATQAQFKADLEHPQAALEVLDRFPVVSRDEVLDDPDAFRSKAFRLGALATTRTSGTTGTPFTTWLEKKALLTSDALWWRRTLWAGYQSGDWIARLVGDPVVPLHPAADRNPWRISHVDRRVYLSTFHLSEATAPRFLEILSRRQPAFIMGYPSAMDFLARVALRQEWRCTWPLRGILFSSEPMYGHQEAAISKAFNTRLHGLYGCAERIVSASQCEEDSYHLSAVDGYVEGQFGIMPPQQPALITGLMNMAMPLIRFQLGDNLTLKPEQDCRCGRTLPTMDPVVTKSEDCLETPSGRRISPSVLTWAFKDIGTLRRAQIIQTQASTVEVLVSPEAIPQADLDRIASRLREYTFGEMTILIKPCEKVDPSDSGKTRFVINCWSRHQETVKQ